MARLCQALLAAGAALAAANQAAPAALLAVDSAGPEHGPTAPSITRALGPLQAAFDGGARATRGADWVKRRSKGTSQLRLRADELHPDNELGDGGLGSRAEDPAGAKEMSSKRVRVVNQADPGAEAKEAQEAAGDKELHRYEAGHPKAQWPHHGHYEEYRAKQEIKGGEYDQKMMKELRRSETDSEPHADDYLKDGPVYVPPKPKKSGTTSLQRWSAVVVGWALMVAAAA
mmetsp:Transcript_56520/g.148639  ORF Transcript_56520/g.148639 Transcript_56520/m.148639 type:complete len:230 (-) Transcript_56520:58-747(-)